MLNSFASRLNSFGGSRNLPLNVRAAAAASGVSPYEIVSLDFANQQYWRKGVRSSLAAVPGITFGANAPNLTADGLLIEDADDAVSLTDLDALGLTSAVLAAGYTVVVEWSEPSLSQVSYVYALSDGSNNNRVALGTLSSGLVFARVTNSGLPEVTESSLGAASTSALNRSALSVGLGGFRHSFSGQAIISDGSESLPNEINSLRLAVNGDNLGATSVTIKSFTIIPRPVSDAQLQALSAL